MRLVLDTNTVVSGFLWEHAPRRLIDAVIDRKIELSTSATLIEKLSGILQREKFGSRLALHRMSAAALVERYQTLADIVEPANISPAVRSDPDDDQVLACALAAHADAIVSGDKRLRNLKSYQGIPILSAAEALRLIERIEPN